MRIGIRACPAGSQKVTDCEAFRFAIDLRLDFVTGVEVALPGQFLAHRDRSRSAQPLLDIELLRLKISQVKSPKWLVGQDVDPQQVEIFAGKIGQSQESPDDRSRGGDARLSRDFGKSSSGKLPAGAFTSSCALPATTSTLASKARLALWLAIWIAR